MGVHIIFIVMEVVIGKKYDDGLHTASKVKEKETFHPNLKTRRFGMKSLFYL